MGSLRIADLQGYAWEITTVEGGWGMDGILKGRESVLNGIANGIDEKEWNPETDDLIEARYSINDLSGSSTMPFCHLSLAERTYHRSLVTHVSLK